MTSNLSRRAVLMGGFASALLFALPIRPAAALTTAQARSLIDGAVRDINAVINSGKSEAAMYRDFETIFKRYADVPTISRSRHFPFL